MVICAGSETAVIYPTGDVAGCELRDDVLGNLRSEGYDFRGIWLGENGSGSAMRGKIDVCKGCYSHCFLSPAILRTPKLWPSILAAAWDIHRNLNAKHMAAH